MSRLESELQVLNLERQSTEDAILRTEADLQDMNDKDDAAQKLLADAEKRLQRDPADREARCDKQQAAVVRERIAEDRPRVRSHLERLKNWLAARDEQLRQFPMEELKEERRLEKLRARLRG